MTTDSPHPSKRLLFNYFHNKLPDDHAIEIEEHLAGCGHCVSSARVVRRVVQLCSRCHATVDMLRHRIGRAFALKAGSSTNQPLFAGSVPLGQVENILRACERVGLYVEAVAKFSCRPLSALGVTLAVAVCSVALIAAHSTQKRLPSSLPLLASLPGTHNALPESAHPAYVLAQSALLRDSTIQRESDAPDPTAEAITATRALRNVSADFVNLQQSTMAQKQKLAALAVTAASLCQAVDQLQRQTAKVKKVVSSRDQTIPQIDTDLSESPRRQQPPRSSRGERPKGAQLLTSRSA